MRLIGLAVVFALGLVLAPLGTAAAQSSEKVPRVGYISRGSSSDPFRLRRFEAFRQGLRELGYVEGRNIALEPRWAEGKYDRYPALAADLVRLKMHVIVAVGGARDPGRSTSDENDTDRHVGCHRSLGKRTRGAASATSSEGMARQGYDLQLTRYDEKGWRATFYTKWCGLVSLSTMAW